MRRRHRLTTFVVIAVVLAIGGLGSLAVGTTRESFPTVRGTVTLPALSGRVEVLRDAYGVPQIYADNAEDLFAAQGYVHAQDRFFEMDVRRHITAGRLSELFGKSQVDTDAYIRTMGWRRVAEAELPLLAASTRRYLDAYAAGVNAYLSSRSAAQLSLEYAVLNLTGPNYTPEAWSAVDSLAWLKAMAWDLDGNSGNETERAVATVQLGADRAADLFPDYDQNSPPIVGQGSVVDGRFQPSARRASNGVVPRGFGGVLAAAEPALLAAGQAETAVAAALGDHRIGAEVGSNSWAISGARTTTGKPILGNDPHLAVSIPSIFEQVGLHCRTVGPRCSFDVTGFSFSGLPGVIIGHNGDIAWGFTTPNVDTQDTFVEQLRGDEVRVGDRWQPLTVREEKITIAGEDAPQTIRVRSSRHGPLLSDVDAQLRQSAELTGGGPAAPPGTGEIGYGVALRWTALTPTPTMDALFALNAATDFPAFRAAARSLLSPAQNLMYADTAGNIGYQLPGAIPVRSKGDGRLPRPGWDTSYDWQGYVPFAELPYAYNPAPGYLVAANQTVVGPQYPRLLTNGQSYGWRSDRLNDLISGTGKISLSDADQLFADTTIGAAGAIVPRLLRVKLSDPWVAEGQQTLVGWDYRADADSAAAAYFHIVFYDILKRTFRDQLPQAFWPTDVDRYYAVVADLLTEPTNPWWDDVNTPQVETRDDILAAAMGDARREATSLMSRDTATWRWDRIHRVTLQNQTLGMSGVALIERLFNRGDDGVAGGPAVVDAMAFVPDGGYRVVNGPAMRMRVDLSNLDDSRWINQSGNSGHAFHDHYADQLPLWTQNQLLPMVSSRARVDATTVDRLELVPSG
ncbi:MAG: penicillin acylase family protein [Propionibacteriaceae bacterium]